MARAPKKCPMCGEVINWKKVDTQKNGFSWGNVAGAVYPQKKDFSADNAAANSFLLRPIGLVGGDLGKKMNAFYCGKCGFSHEYKA